jgi:hypothetical protein
MAVMEMKMYCMGMAKRLWSVIRVYLTPKGDSGDDWLRTNIFHTTCTVADNVCKMIIDSGSCENVVSEEAVQKLQLKTDHHPKPYKLSWLNKGSEVKVDRRCLVSFSVGKKYFDNA